MKLLYSCVLCLAFSPALAAQLHEAPPVVGSIYPAVWEDRVDYTVACNPPLPGPTLCLPQSKRVPMYMRLANWRLVGATTPDANCVINRTYGYTVKGPWVTPECPGVFTAPNLRFGGEYNHLRLR